MFPFIWGRCLIEVQAALPAGVVVGQGSLVSGHILATSLSTCVLPPNPELASHALFMKRLPGLKVSRGISETNK